MTRNFRNQRRDGTPAPRNASSGGYREDQASRPARPRLSRDAVDRAWENGATRSYADYRPRQHPSNAPAPRQGRPAPAYERSRQPQDRRPYGASQESYGTPRQHNYQTRPQPEGRPYSSRQPGYRPSNGQAGLGNERRTHQDASRQTGGSREYPSYGSQRPPRFQTGTPNTYRGTERSPRFQEDTPSAPSRGSQRPPRSQAYDAPRRYDNQERAPRFQQNARPPYQARTFENSPRERERFNRGQQYSQPSAPRRDDYHPRWQSRPGSQHAYAPQRYENAPEQPGRAQFEGDYERFTDHQDVEQTPRPSAPYTRPVTHLPDGRVLKGSRPSQRKQARFWNGVEQESETLLSHPSHPPTEDEVAPTRVPEPGKPASRAARPKKPGESRAHKVKTVKTARAQGPKATTAKVARKNAGGSQKAVTRPSQRGYKWPSAGGE